MSKLADAREALYTVFQNYPFPKDMEGCPCCINESDIKHFNLMSNVPKNQLTTTDFEWWYSDALNTWGTPKEFLYFFPRIFELELAGYNYCGALCKSMQCLEHLNWREILTNKQINAIETFAMAYLVEQFSLTRKGYSECPFHECHIWLSFLLGDKKTHLFQDDFFNFLLKHINHQLELTRQKNVSGNSDPLKNSDIFPLSIFENFCSDSTFILNSGRQQKLMSLWPATTQDFVHYAYMINSYDRIYNFIFDHENIILSSVKKKWLTNNLQMIERMFFDPDNQLHEAEISAGVEQTLILINYLE